MSSFASAGGGSAVASIPDWTKLNTTESLIDLFRGDELSDIDTKFKFCKGIHSDSNIETAHEKLRDIYDANSNPTLGAIFAGITEADKYDDTLKANQWLKVWLTQKFISTYGGAIIMDVYAKFEHLLGENIGALQALHAHVLSNGIEFSFDVHGELNIQPDGINEYNNVIRILGGTLPKSSLLFNPSIFDETVRSKKSYEEIMEKQRQITIIDLQNFIIKRDACRQTVDEIGNKISEYHYKILDLQKSLDATASQEMTQSIQNASQITTSASKVYDSALQVIDQANTIAENISTDIGIELPPPQIASTTREELATLTTEMNNLYYDLGDKIIKLDEVVKDIKETYISLRSILYYNLSNPQSALGKLDQTLFSGTNEENGGLGIVLRLGENKEVTDCVRHYLQKTNREELTFVGDGLTFTNNGPEINAYNPSEAMILNPWNFFRNFTCGKYPSFAWLFIVYCILKNNNGVLSDEAIKVLIMTLFDDCTHSRSDNIISVILRTHGGKGNTTYIKSELLYKFFETLGIRYSLNLLHCMGKPSTESIEDFKKKVKYFVKNYIGENIRMPFDRRIAEIGDTQTLGSQESLRSQVDFFNIAVDTFSQMTEQVSDQIKDEIQILSQPDFQTLSALDFLTEGYQSATGGGGGEPFFYDSDDSGPFQTKNMNPVAGNQSTGFGYPLGGGSQGSIFGSEYDNPVDRGSHNESAMTMDPLTGGELFQYDNPIAEGSQNSNEIVVLDAYVPTDDGVGSDYDIPPNQADAERFFKNGIIAVKKGTKSANLKKTYKGPSSGAKGPFKKGGRKTRRPKKNKRTTRRPRRTKERAKYTRKR